MDYPTRHLLLRDRRDWLGVRSGLDVDRDGTLSLAALPGPANGKAIEIAVVYPYVREMSGIALGPCDGVFVADTAHDRVLYVDALCHGRAWLGTSGSGPGELNAPRGLALTTAALLVADSGNARVQQFALPALEAADARFSPRPIGVAVDSKERVVVVDAIAKRVRRLDAMGFPDGPFDAAVAGSGKLIDPLAVAIGFDDRVFVSDAGANAVFVFDETGSFEHALAAPPAWLPGALAVGMQRIYVADAATGAIEVFDDSGSSQRALPGFRGPVSAMAAHANGNLYVKTDLGADYVVLEAGRSIAPFGTLAAGPFDAGEDSDWERAWLDVQEAAGTQCTVRVVQKPQPAPAPAPGDWVELPSRDALLALLAPAAVSGARRFLWLDVQMTSTLPGATPRLLQLRAATAAENYLDYLPSTYGRNDTLEAGKATPGVEGFLSRLLKLLRSEIGAVEERIDEMPRLADPAFVDASDLPRLAQWLGLELPQIADDDQRRALLSRAVALFARRGTRASIAEMVELHTGVRPKIVEAFDGRTIWMLGERSRLDFETRLPALDPNGLVVPDRAPAECCSATETTARCPCDAPADLPERTCDTGPIGRAIVGESGPLDVQQIGAPLFSEDAWRFCVLVDSYRADNPGTLAEIRRVVEREKPAHTDYRIETFDPELRVGLQARIGIDAIVGGDPPGLRLAATLGIATHLGTTDAAARVGDALLGDTLTLT